METKISKAIETPNNTVNKLDIIDILNSAHNKEYIFMIHL